MTSQPHVTAQFSDAYEHVLTPDESLRFKRHLDECPACRADFAAFQRSIDAVRALPPLRMPAQVHIPSSSRPAPQPRRSERRRWMPAVLTFGGAAAGAALIAAVVVVAVSRGEQTPTGGHSEAGFGAAQAPCPSAAQGAVGAAPATYSHRVTATDPGRPGQQLVLATRSGSVTAGGHVSVYAALLSTQPGGVAAAGVSCLRVDGAPGGSLTVSVDGTAPGQGLLTVVVPSGTADGTVLHFVATVQGSDAQSGSPPLVAVLSVTVSSPPHITLFGDRSGT